MAVSASVILPTRNRSSALRRSLLSLLRCDGGDEPFEIIVVDNASTDDTAAVVTALIRDNAHRQLRYVLEDRAGLHYARHAGARVARAGVLLYTEDDAEVEREWVRAYVEAFASHPEMVAASGPVLPRWEAEPPAWVVDAASYDDICLPLSLIDHGPEFVLPSDGDLFGGNMGIRSDALHQFGGFRPELIGQRIVGSGEWGLQMAMLRAGVPIGWIPAARVWHCIPGSRLQPRYFERRVRMESTSLMFERWHLARRDTRSLTRDFIRIVRANWRLWLRAARVRPAADLHSITVRSEALKGIYELSYLWQIISRRDIRGFLDAERFGP